MHDQPIGLLRGAWTHCGRQWRWQQSSGCATGFNLWLVLQGQGTLRTEGKTYTLSTGDCFLLRMWESIRAEHSPDNPLVVPWICFDLLDPGGRPLPPGRCPRPPEHRRIPNLTFFGELMRHAIARHEEVPRRAGEALLWLRAALAEIASLDRNSQLSGLELQHSVMIESLCATIRQAPESIHGMKALADSAKCSVDHLIRLFRRYKAVTPWEYVIRCRVEKASHLLQFSTHTLGQIASLTGYADIYAFSKQFKARTGRPPSTYRKRP